MEIKSHSLVIETDFIISSTVSNTVLLTAKLKYNLKYFFDIFLGLTLYS